MDPKITHIFNQINVEPLSLFRPLLAGMILNSFYSSLILKKTSGIEITDQVRDQTLQEVVDLYGRIDGAMQECDRTTPEKTKDQ